jgi:hypothetical protein
LVWEVAHAAAKTKEGKKKGFVLLSGPLQLLNLFQQLL